MSAQTGVGRPDTWKKGSRQMVRGWLSPLARRLARWGVDPNWLTWGGLLLTGIAGIRFARGHFAEASLWAIAGSALDALDGAVARERGRVTAFGAFLDSTVDRVSDTFLFVGIAAYYFYLPVITGSSVSRVLESKFFNEEPTNYWLTGLSALLALGGAYMVSYTRARAEGLGLECKVGWFERPERLIVLLGAGLFGVGVWMEYALLLLVVMTWITVAQRVFYVRRQLGTASLPSETGDA